MIKTHGSVSCSIRKRGAHKWSKYILTGTTKSQFSRTRSCVILDLNGTKFTVEVPFTQGRPHSKFKEDSFSHSQDTSNQTFKKIFFVFYFSRFCINHHN